MPSRPIQEIESDFDDLMASRLPGTVARDKFERLWDETNSAAAELVSTSGVTPYLSLLKRMHQAFEYRYGQVFGTNGRKRSP